MNRSFNCKLINGLLPLLLLGLLSCNPNRHNCLITLSEVYPQEKILPVLALMDLAYDTAASADFIRHRNELLGSKSDTLLVTTNDYLCERGQNSLFKKFEPNLLRARAKSGASCIRESGVLGFSIADDTAYVNSVLSSYRMDSSGKFSFAWLSCGKIGFTVSGRDTDMERKNLCALVAFNPCKTAVEVPDTEVQRIKGGGDPVRKVLNLFFGHHPMEFKVSFKPKDVSSIKSAFSDDTMLLVKCTINGKLYFYTGKSSSIAHGNFLLKEDEFWD